MAHRWRQGERKGAWQPTRREAVRNARAAGIARHDRESGGIVWLDGATIETGDGRRKPSEPVPSAA